MVNYNEYLSKLKERSPSAPDFTRLQAQIVQKAGRRKFPARLALAGALAIFVLSFAVYFVYPSLTASSNDVLISYVFEQPESIDGPILDYVLND